MNSKGHMFVDSYYDVGYAHCWQCGALTLVKPCPFIWFSFCRVWRDIGWQYWADVNNRRSEP